MSDFLPKISVMIITYNQEDFIAETIESVIYQDYENLEVIVSDDASTDRTADIISDYARRYPGKVFPIFNQKNLGITGNSNSAFFACTGELIAVLGGDDLFLPGKIRAQFELFKNPEVVLSYHSVEIFLHQTGEVLFTTNTTPREDLNDAYDIISKGGIPGASSVMVRRSACPEHGFDPQFPVVSDWIFYIEVAMRGKVEKLDGIYGRYRKHGEGASESTFKLLSESLRTLDVIQQRYPDDVRLRRVCQKGAYRYLLGELYRQVVKADQVKVLSLTKLMINESTGVNRLVTKCISFFLNLRCVLVVLSSFIVIFKNKIKRLV